MGALFLLSPVVNPWYVLWLLPFVVLRPSCWGIVAPAAVSLSYIHGHNLGDEKLLGYAHPVWVRPLEYGMIALALIADVTRRARRSRPAGREDES